MHTQSLINSPKSRAHFHCHHHYSKTSHLPSGMINELAYSEQQFRLPVLLPLLRQLGEQSRWLLWVTPQHKLSKKWLLQANLPTDKVMQLSQIDPDEAIYAMECALRSGNYSIVLGYLPPLKSIERERLKQAAKQGGSFGLIIYPEIRSSTKNSTYKQLKIQANLFH